MSLILGIDPGIATTGFGVIQKQGNKINAIDYGKIITKPKDNAPKRLKIIFNELTKIIKKYKLDAIAIERIFFNKNTKTALSVGEARGVVMLCSANFDIPLSEYTPLEVKTAVVGYGRADKKQIKYMVKVILNLKEIPHPDDTADALAIAICHVNSSRKVF